MDKIIIEKYNAAWPTEFQKIKNYLKYNINGYLKIVHIGSTSILNCDAKPIIDLVIEIEDINELPNIDMQLNKLGYIHEGDKSIKLRYAFKSLNSSFMNHHLYVCIKNSQKYNEQIAFRDYLINNPEEIKKYVEVKRRLALTHQNDREAYTEGKTDFILSILQQTSYVKDPTFIVQNPNYHNCILNIDASIAKKHNVILDYPSNPLIDDILNKNDYKHYILMLLDGMGSNTLKNLPNDAFLNRYKIADISTIFPPTTSAVIPATLSGLAPISTAWLGWENYFKEIDKNVVLFKNTDYFTDEALSINIEKDVLPYSKFYANFNVPTFELMPAFKPDGFPTFKEMLNKIIDITYENKRSFTYAYWDNPDAIMHEYGTTSNEAKNVLEKINDILTKVAPKLNKDTCLIITADHGHQDVLPIDLTRFTKITELLKREPCNEGRCLFFHVSDGKKNLFEERFRLYFESFFDLYKKEEFLKNEFLGLKKYSNMHPRVKELLGDYIAVAKERYYFTYSANSFRFKSHHGGKTKNEMVTPLIVFEK